MNKGLKIIRIIAFAICLILVIGLVYNVLAWKDTNGDYISSVKQLEATDDNLIDAVFVGSSHCYCGIYPSVLWDEYGISGFDMAISGQDKISSYYQVKNLCKTQSPKVVVVDLFGTTFERGTIVGNDYRNYLALGPSIDSIKMVDEYFDKGEKKDYNFRFPIIHTRYKELGKYDFVDNQINNYLRGEAYGSFISPVTMREDIYNIDEITPISEENKEWIDRMMELADKEGFELEFIVIPADITLDEQKLINGVCDYIKNNNGNARDFNKEIKAINLDETVDFIDKSHLNSSGANKFTKYIATNILSKYDLSDHRGDERYYQWDKDSEIIRHYKAKETLPYVWDGVATMEGIKELDDCVTIINVDTQRFEDDVNYFEMLVPFGMDYDSFSQGGTWIYTNGELQKVCENIIGYPEYIINLGRHDVLRVGYYGSGEKTNILINKKWKPEDMKGLNVVVYDELLEEIIYNKAY